jgi:hypothetical protein
MYYQSHSALTQWLDLTDYTKYFYIFVEKSFGTFVLNLTSTSVTIFNNRIDMCLFLTALANQRALDSRLVNETRWTSGVEVRLPTQVLLLAYNPTNLDRLLHELIARPSITVKVVVQHHATEWWMGCEEQRVWG